MFRRPRLLLALVAVVVITAAVAFDLSGSVKKAHLGSKSPTACVYTSHSIAALNAFDALVGRQISCAVVYNSSATSWSQLAVPWFLSDQDQDHRWDTWATGAPGRQLVIAESLAPAGAPANWRQLGAEGAYDATFRTFAQRLVAAGLGRSIIRIAAEGNGNWFVDNAGTTLTSQRQWAAYWARVAAILHGTKGAHFVTDWTISAGAPAVPLAHWYPGDDAVDIVGLDQHDLALPPVTAQQPARWDSQVSTPGGVRSVLAFAEEHKKPISVPEWGVDSVAELGGGDDAYYMTQMAALLSGGDVVYDGYWEKTGADGLLSDNPKALAIYREQVLPHSSFG